MLSAIKKLNVLPAEDEEVMTKVAEIAEANGFKPKNEQDLVECLAHTEYDDWHIGDAKPVVKASIRKLMSFSKQESKKHMDDGEIFDRKPECGENDTLKNLSQLLSAKDKPKVHHVETAKMLKDKCGNWGQTAYFLLPDSDSTNEMASALETISKKTRATPFVHCRVTKFCPEWQSCDYKHKDGWLLQPAIMMPALMRWAMAAQATGMLPMHVGCTHADICMRVAEEARRKQKQSTTAAAYDELLQKKLADMCIKGVADFDPAMLLSTFDREIFEQACQLADQKASQTNHYVPNGNGPKGNGKGGMSFYKDRQYGSNASYQDKERGQSWNKRQADQHWKNNEAYKKRKY